MRVGGGWGAKDQIIAFRNAMGHGHFHVEPDEARQIGAVRFEHEKKLWQATFTSAQLEEVLGHVGTFIRAISG